MSADHILMDSGDTVDVSHDVSAWATNEGTTLSSYTVAVTGGVTKVTDSESGGVITVRITASASGTVVYTSTFADGQIRQRTQTITVDEL